MRTSAEDIEEGRFADDNAVLEARSGGVHPRHIDGGKTDGHGEGGAVHRLAGQRDAYLNEGDVTLLTRGKKSQEGTEAPSSLLFSSSSS